jgi:hypothetical protein
MISCRRQKKPVDRTNLPPFPVFRSHAAASANRKEKIAAAFINQKRFTE